MKNQSSLMKTTTSGDCILHSPDNGFTRYNLQIIDGSYACYLNESRCFKRGTHDLMAKQNDIDLNKLESLPWTTGLYRKTV